MLRHLRTGKILCYYSLVFKTSHQSRHLHSIVVEKTCSVPSAPFLQLYYRNLHSPLQFIWTEFGSLFLVPQDFPVYVDSDLVILWLDELCIYPQNRISREIVDDPSMEVLKAKLDGVWAAWPSGSSPCPQGAGGWNKMNWKVLSNPNHSLSPRLLSHSLVCISFMSLGHTPVL